MENVFVTHIYSLLWYSFWILYYDMDAIKLALLELSYLIGLKAWVHATFLFLDLILLIGLFTFRFESLPRGSGLLFLAICFISIWLFLKIYEV